MDLKANENSESMDCDNLKQDEPNLDDYLDDETVELLSKEFTYISSTGVKWISKSKSAQIGIAKYYKPSWSLQPRNHFVQYSDIQLNAQDSVNDLLVSTNDPIITHKELIGNLNEWKFHYIISQVNNLIDYENESLKVIKQVENLIQNTKFDGISDITFKLNESIKANTQRHHFINEQLDETQILIHKFFDHKEKFKNQMLISASTSKSSSNLNPLQNKNNNISPLINPRNSLMSSSLSGPGKARKNLGKKAGITTRSNFKSIKNLDSKLARS
jgi:hypothetical protein